MDSKMDSQVSRKANSFSHPSSFHPEQKQLKHTLSSPAAPSRDEESEVSPPQTKYSPRTRSPSDGSDLRWYFCKTILRPDEPAASVPLTELVGKGEYFRFSKSDSDALEAAFLKREEELVRAWWKEYAESREGPSSNANSSRDAHSGEAGRPSQTDGDDFEPGRISQLNAWEEEENVGVLVKGGLYEVDLLSRRCLPVYWRGDHRRVLRGHWFARKGGLDWLPMREDLCEQLEIAYESQIWRRRRFQPSGLYAARVNLHGATPGLHALFTGEDDSWEAWLCVDTTGISLVLGLRGGGVKLRRGFALPEAPQPTQDELRQHKEEEMDDYASKVPVRHVIFMVHGIGQRLEKANLVDDVGAFRRSVAMLSEQHLTKYQRDSQRVLFIPCQWRRELKLGGESAVEDCTLEGVRALRTMLSATVHDVLYYMSPVYCQDIIDSVSRSLNRLYRKFVRRNPFYDGKVSIYGHSLGTVLSYDILCHQTDESSTSAAPITSIEPEDNLRKDRTGESKPSTASIVEVKPDINETCKEVLSIHNSEIENGVSPTEDSDESSSTDNGEKASEAEKDSETESIHFQTELESNAESHMQREKVSSEVEANAESDVQGEKASSEVKASAESDVQGKKVSNEVEANAESDVQGEMVSSEVEANAESDVQREKVSSAVEANAESDVQGRKVSSEVEANAESDVQREKVSSAVEANAESDVQGRKVSGEVEASAGSDVQGEKVSSEVEATAESDVQGEKVSSKAEANAESDVQREKVSSAVEANAESDVQGRKVSSEVEASAGSDVQGEKVSSEVEATAESDVQGEKVSSKAEANAESDVQGEEVSSGVESSAGSDVQGEKDSREVEASAESDVQGEKVSSEVEANAESDVQGKKVSSEAEANAESDVQGEKVSSEVEALKAEVKMLHEKLYALTQEKSLEAQSSSSAPSLRSSHLATFVMSENADSRQPDGGSAGLEDPQTSETPPTAATGAVPVDRRFSSKKSFTPYISYTKLDFEVDTFYAVGSPLGVFLSLRNIRIGVGSGQEYWEDDGVEEEMPAVRQMMNIFHPYDPVAYRVEPLICRELVSRRPKFIPYHKGGKRLHIGMQEFQDDLSARSKAIVGSISSVGTRVASKFFQNQAEKIDDKAKKKEKTYGVKMMEKLTGGPDGRVDYQLQDSTFEHPYLAVLSSHTAYWHDLDTALFILKHLYRDVPEEPPAPPSTPAERLDIIEEDSEVPDVSNIDEETVEAVESSREQEDFDLEELPLTFSSKDQIAAVLANANKVKADWMG